MKCLCHFSDPCPKTVGIFDRMFPTKKPKTYECNCELGNEKHMDWCSIHMNKPVSQRPGWERPTAQVFLTTTKGDACDCNPGYSYAYGKYVHKLHCKDKHEEIT